MQARALLAVAVALLVGVGLGYSVHSTPPTREPVLAASSESESFSTIDEALLVRLVDVLERLERRLGEPRPTVEHSSPQDSVPRTSLGTTEKLETDEIVDVLRSIDARLSMAGARGGIGSASLAFAGPSGEREAWMELQTHRAPMRVAELERFFREREGDDFGDITPDLYFMEPWDVIRKFGWPSELEKGSAEKGFWELRYKGLSIHSDLEDQPITALDFKFYSNQLSSYDYDID